MLALTVALAGFLGANVAVAATPGTGGWYWPTGSEKLGSMGPWWQDRGYAWHLAKDIGAPAGKPTYAVGSGTVLESQYVRGYGPGGGLGGAVVILHRTATGREFKALYGHVSNLRYRKGDKVAAGAVIAVINNSSPNHLHFGIHPGAAYPPDGNPYRGHTYTASTTYGWVDPVAYLRKNPRAIAYSAPALPVVRSVMTTSVALEAWVSNRELFWVEGSTEQTSAWRYELPDGVIEPTSTPLPATGALCDRFRAAIKGSPPSIAVSDRVPVVTAKVSDETPRRGTSVEVVGTVTNAAGKPFKGARLALERLSGSEWVRVGGGLTDTSGAYFVEFKPASRSRLRIRFVPPTTYVTSQSATVTVVPHVSVSKPSLSTSTPRLGGALVVRSTVLPKNSAALAQFQLERKEGSRWVRVDTKRATSTVTREGRSLRASLACSRAGTYRVRAYLPADTRYAATGSAWAPFRVE